MKDAEILERMIDKELDKYLLDTSVTDNYDACQKEVDKKLEYFYKRVKEVCAEMAHKYEIDHNTILLDMVIPSLEAEAGENK